MSSIDPPNIRSARWKRLALLLALPAVLLAVGAYVWFTGGRYVTTDNAYVKRDKVAVSSEIAGRIVSVEVNENDRVAAGTVLFRLDEAPLHLNISKVEAELANARLSVAQMRAAYGERLADLQAAEEEVLFRRKEFVRQRELQARGFAAQAAYDQAHYRLTAAEQRAATERQAVQTALAALGGDPDIDIDLHPLVQEAQAKLDRAKLDLDYAVVRAPVAGVVSRSERLLPGQYAIIGAPMVTIVQDDVIWVEANFKETDLTHMASGQKAWVTVDAYPGRTLQAEVSGIGAATGAEFALLPPQNATGNWVKVVQRVPVRLRVINPDAGVAISTGLSAEVTVDTGYQRSLPATARNAMALENQP